MLQAFKHWSIKTMRYLFITTRKAIIKQMDHNKLWQGSREIRNFHTLLERILLWKTTWRFLRMLNIELSHDPVIPLLGTHPRNMHTLKSNFVAYALCLNKAIVRLNKSLRDETDEKVNWRK